MYEPNEPRQGSSPSTENPQPDEHNKWLKSHYHQLLKDYTSGKITMEQLEELLVKEREDLENQATTDSLTGALNRRGFARELTTELETISHLPGDHTGVLAFIDIDKLKPVNDEHGHQVGDKLLQIFVGTIHEVMVESLEAIYLQNPRVVILFGRIGGDEFGVYFGGCDRKLAETIIHTAQTRIKENVSAELPFIPQQTISAGLTYVKKGDTVESGLKRADTAMYTAKDKRDDIYFIFWNCFKTKQLIIWLTRELKKNILLNGLPENDKAQLTLIHK